MATSSNSPSSRRKPAAPSICVGTRAPWFELPCTPRGDDRESRVTLDDYRDRWLVLVFYPRDFSMVCPTELTALSVQYEAFLDRDCDILGISTDSVETHLQWMRTPRAQGGLGCLEYPLAADEDGAVCQAYGVYLPRQNVALRGLFIIDPNGVLQYQVVHNLSVGRRSDEVLRVLEGLQTGGLCPENWARDEPTLDPTKVIGTGSVVDNYRIEAEIGSGTYGIVFRARDLTLERTVALKVFKLGAAGASRRALDEARAAAALNHPNVCTIYAVNESDGVPMIVMEHIDGQPLKRMLENGRLEANQARDIARQIARGMAAAHASQVVHGDLKPANIMVAPDNFTKVMDFGLAHREIENTPTSETGAWETADSSSGISGTPDYMSPEQARSEAATSHSDVFAMGLIIYEMVSGQKAIRGNNLLHVLRQIDAIDAEHFAGQLSEPFATIVRRSLVRDPHQRQITMAEIAAMLE